jgi:hypothetical protein
MQFCIPCWKSVVLVFFEVRVMGVKSCSGIIFCALTDQWPVAGLIVFSLCENIAVEYSDGQK